MHDVTSNFRSIVLNSIEEDVASFSFLQDSSCTSNISIVPETVSEALEKTEKQQGGWQPTLFQPSPSCSPRSGRISIKILYSHY